MKKQKQNPFVYKIARQFLGFCPICRSTTKDRRYKEGKTIDSCNIYRSSNTSVTMRCKQCGLCSTVTWKALAQAIATKADSLAHREEYAELYLFYTTAYHTLAKHVNIIGTIRTKKA